MCELSTGHDLAGRRLSSIDGTSGTVGTCGVTGINGEKGALGTMGGNMNGVSMAIASDYYHGRL